MRRLWPVLCALAVIFVTATGGDAMAQTLGKAISPSLPWWRVFGALLFCLLLALGGAYALRARLGLRMPSVMAGDQKHLKLLETVRLSHQIDICLLRWDGRDLIVAAGPQGATLLAERAVAPTAPVASADAL